ncbi:MAG TPA: O-antigen ligase family protein [Vicinamibacteria bacterium]
MSATHAVPAVALPGPADRAALAARRSRRELRPGLLLAFAFAWGLAAARFIDVSEDGKAMLLFGTSFFVAITSAAFFRPRFYLPLAAAYLPFSKVYPLPVAGITGANMTNFVLALGFVALASSRMQGRLPVPARFADLLALAYVGAASLALLPTYAADPDLLDLAMTYRGWLAPMVFYLLARGLVRNREDVRGLLWIMAWTTLFIALDVWKEGMDRSSRGSIDAARVRGLMEQANAMGAFLVYYGVPLLALAVGARSLRRALPYLAGFLVVARAILFTFSRAAYLALAGGVATVLLFGNPLLLAAAGGGGAAALVLFPSLVPSSVRERLDDTTTSNTVYAGDGAEVKLDRSSAHRLVIWRGAGRMIAAQPVQGVGLGRFQRVIGQYTEVPLRKTDPHDAHNAFILVAAEHGLPVLALLLLLFAAWAVLALRLRFRHRHPVDRSLGLAFLGTLGGVFVSGLLGSRFSDEALVAWFWMLAALVVAASRFRVSPRPRRRRA